MLVRRVIAIAAALVALPLLIAPAASAGTPAKSLVFKVALQSAGTDTYELPNDVNYGQGAWSARRRGGAAPQASTGCAAMCRPVGPGQRMT